jgi:hypothetical protein
MYVDGVYKKEPLIFIPIGWNMLKLLLPAFANLIQTLQVNELVLICCRFAMCPLFVLFCEGRYNYTILLYFIIE